MAKGSKVSSPGDTKYNPRKEFKRRAGEEMLRADRARKDLEKTKAALAADPYKGGKSPQEKMLEAAMTGGAAAAGTVATGAGLERAAMGLGEQGFQAQTIAEAQQGLGGTIESATARGAGIAEQSSLAQAEQARQSVRQEEADMFAKQQYADGMMQQAYTNRLAAQEATMSNIQSGVQLAAAAGTMGVTAAADIGSIINAGSLQGGLDTVAGAVRGAGAPQYNTYGGGTGPAQFSTPDTTLTMPGG